MVPIDGPEHNMYVSIFKLSICDRRADRPVSGAHWFAVHQQSYATGGAAASLFCHSFARQ